MRIFALIGIVVFLASCSQEDFDKKIENYFDRKGLELFDHYIDAVVDFRNEKKRLAEKPAILDELRDPIENFYVESASAQGPKNAPIRLTLFIDFESPYSAQAFFTLKALVESYAGAIQWQIRHNPLVQDNKRSKAAAIAALAAQRQSKFWEMVEILFLNQNRLGEEDLQRYARSINLDLQKFNFDRKSKEVSEQLEKDLQYAQKQKWLSNPIAVINGGIFPGARPERRFRYIFDTILKG